MFPPPARRIVALQGNRTGYVIIDQRTGRVDQYDSYGQATAPGRIDLYDTKSNPTGYGTMTAFSGNGNGTKR